MSSAANISKTTSEIDSDAINKLKWFGWIALSAVALGWIAWVSRGVIGAELTKQRQQTHYEQLREDIAEIKSLIMNRP